MDALATGRTVIRPAVVADAPILAEAEAATARTPGLLVSRPHELAAAAFARTIAALTARGRYVVALEGDRIVGHALLEPLGLEAIRHVFRLTVVAHPGCTERGVGTALLTDLLDWARRPPAGDAPAVHKIELQVRATNERALRLYRKLGFVEEGRLRDRVRLPDGTFVDDLLMAWFPGRATGMPGAR